MKINSELIKTPLKGLFDPSCFTLPEIDTTICNFLKNTVLSKREGQIVSMLAFFHYPQNTAHESSIFYRWFTWTEDLKMKGNILNKFHFINTKERIALNYSKCTKTLAAQFMKILSNKLKQSKPNNIKKLALKRNGKSHIVESLKGSRSRLWLIEDPASFDGFTETLEGAKTQWSLYYPIFVSDRLAGLFVIDGENPQVARNLKSSKKERQVYLTDLSLLELSIECIFKAYYTQLELPPSNVDLTATYWDRSEEAFVFTPAFLDELLRTYLFNDKQCEYYKTPPKVYLVSYWDVNGIKAINDTLSSHPTGNEIIRSVSRWLHDGFLDLLKKAKILDKSKFWVTRWGGDEFIVILAIHKNLKRDEKIKVQSLLHKLPECHVGSFIKRRLRLAIAELTSRSWLKGLSIKKSDAEVTKVLKRVGISGGFSCCKDNTKTAYDNARDEAENAMYIAKQLMKNRDMKGSCGICYNFSDETAVYIERKKQEGIFFDRLAEAENLSTSTKAFKQ